MSSLSCPSLQITEPKLDKTKAIDKMPQELWDLVLRQVKSSWGSVEAYNTQGSLFRVSRHFYKEIKYDWPRNLIVGTDEDYQGLHKYVPLSKHIKRLTLEFAPPPWQKEADGQPSEDRTQWSLTIYGDRPYSVGQSFFPYIQELSISGAFLTPQQRTDFQFRKDVTKFINLFEASTLLLNLDSLKTSFCQSCPLEIHVGNSHSLRDHRFSDSLCMLDNMSHLITHGQQLLGKCDSKISSYTHYMSPKNAQGVVDGGTTLGLSTQIRSWMETEVDSQRPGPELNVIFDGIAQSSFSAICSGLQKRLYDVPAPKPFSIWLVDAPSQSCIGEQSKCDTSSFVVKDQRDIMEHYTTTRGQTTKEDIVTLCNKEFLLNRQGL